MKVEHTKLQGIKIIKPVRYNDERGYFQENFNSNKYKEHNLPIDFVQDNYSFSARGVLRGLHFQKTKPQGKLVSCIDGNVLDVIVDIRKNSQTFGEHIAIELSETNHLQVWIPEGFAHGFCVLSDTARFLYKCTSYYDPSDEAGLLWNDPDLSIDWPISKPIISEKDKNNILFKSI